MNMSCFKVKLEDSEVMISLKSRKGRIQYFAELESDVEFIGSYSQADKEVRFLESDEFRENVKGMRNGAKVCLKHYLGVMDVSVEKLDSEEDELPEDYPGQDDSDLALNIRDEQMGEEAFANGELA